MREAAASGAIARSRPEPAGGAKEGHRGRGGAAAFTYVHVAVDGQRCSRTGDSDGAGGPGLDRDVEIASDCGGTAAIGAVGSNAKGAIRAVLYANVDVSEYTGAAVEEVYRAGAGVANIQGATDRES